MTPTAPLPTATATASGPVALWHFEERGGTTVGDSSGFSNNGVAQNGMGWTSGQVGGAGSFDGLDDQVSVPDSSSLSVTGPALTLEAWVRPTAVNGYRVLIHKELQYSLAIYNGQLTYADSATWSYATLGYYGSIPMGTWSHVAVTFDGSLLRYYINGTEVGTQAHSGSLSATTNPVCLGSYNCSSLRFAGGLDEVAVYSRALSPTEVYAHYISGLASPATPVALWHFDEGNGTTVGDSSGFGNDGAAQNGMGWTSGQVGGAGSFDGLDDQVSVPDSPSLSVTGPALSLEAWVRPMAVNGYRVLIHKDFQYSLAIYNGQLTYADSATWSYATLGYYGGIPAGTWSHVAVTFDGSLLRYYVNGAQIGTRAHAGNLSATTNPVCLGSYNCSSLRFAGGLDEAAVYRRVLSPDEVKQHYDDGRPSAAWNFDEGSGTTVGDSSGFGNTGLAQNGMGWNAGKFGTAGAFDGINDQVSVPDSASLSVTGPAITLEAWVQPTAVNGYRVLIHKERQYSLALLDGQLTYADSIDWSYANLGYYGNVPAGVWTHVAVTFDGSLLRYYVNGSEVGARAHSGSLSATGNPVCLGSYACGALYFAGSLDEARVYPRALSAAEIAARFRAGG
jgi:hypothetical protein